MFIRRVQKLFVSPQWFSRLGLVVLLAAGLLLRTGSTYANANQTIGGASAWLNAESVLPDFPANKTALVTPLSPQADVMVTTTADSGAGSLRQAILDAAPGDTIVFDASLFGQTITLASTLIITESLTIDGSGLANQVTISGGGTVRVFDISTAGNTVILNNLTIANGAFAGNCGGINNNGSTLTVSGCNFNNNNASAGNGGAIYNNTGGMLAVSECNFNGNRASSQGGAVYTYQGTVDINSSSFYSNTSVNDGSVLFSFFGSGITVTIANSSFYNNSVTGYNKQAAVYVRTNLVIKNSTFSGNRAVNRVVDISDFANCTPACTIQLGNNIFADVASGTGHVAGGGGTYIDLGHNMVDTNESAIFNSPSSQLNTDPLLGSWANNGGSTPTFALLTGSPAIDAGDDAMCAAPPVNGLDQRGVTRPQGAHCDIGAYELEAQGMVVNTNADNATAGDSFCTLREAMTNANSNSDTTGGDCAAGNGADTITFAGDYTITLGASLPTVSDPLTIDGSAKAIRLSGQHLYQVLTVTNGTAATLNALTIADGYCDGVACVGGGGIQNFGALTVKNSFFISNTIANVGGMGGAIANETGATLEVMDTLFSGNAAADYGFGSAICNSGILTATRSTFTGNIATSGGGTIINYDTSMIAMVVSSTFSTNTGGAILNGGVLTVTASTFTGNTNDGPGGAILNNQIATIVNSTFSGNAAPEGGAILNREYPGCRLTVINSTFSGNSATGEGGGISNYHADAGTLNLANNIFTGSTGGDCVLSFTGTLGIQLNNLMADTGANACELVNGANGNQTGVGAPLLDTLADNGGDTQTMALLPGSPAIDAGDDAMCAAPLVNGRDQRGVIRPQGAHCDIGAYEREQNNPPQIFGAPNMQATVGEAYAFTPGATDADGDTLTFAIQNRPTWASFYTATGVLSGTPAVGDVGETTGIIISVSDGQAQASLPAFTLGVVQPQNFNHPPAFRIRQAPATALVGQRWCFDPQAYDPDADAITVAVQNRPAWITEFNAQTGRMCGTPAAAHVGASGAIQLTVTDPSAAADSLTFSIQVNSPTLPCRPTALEFSAALGAGFVQQGIACSNTTLAQAQGMFNSRVLDFTANVTLDYNSRSALLNIQPSSAGLAIGTYNHSIRFTLRGVEYTVPVKLIVTAPPPSTLVLSRSSLDFSARVGESAASQAVTLRSTSAALNWTASANQNWVTLTPANGTATTPPGQISIGIDMTKISAEGPRSAVVTISDQNNKQYLIAITLNVAPAPTQPGGADSGDIVLIALEVTQGLQNWDHEIPLIQGRTTWVRAHVRNRTNAYIEGVTAELEVWRGTTKLGTLAPEPIFSNMGGPLRIFPTGDPSCDEICERQIAIENSFDFKLDDSWTNGALTFKLVGKSHAIACNEQDATKDCRLAASFETQVRPLYKVRYFGATSAQCAELTQIVEQYLPVRIQAVCDPGRYTFLSGALNSNSLSELHKLWVKNGSPADTLYFGLYASGDGGLAYREFPIAGVIDVTKKNSSSLAKGSIMVAHEVLHTFDLGHGYISPNYPPSDPRYPADSRFPKYALSRSAGGLGQLSPDLTGLNAHYGFVTGNILLPEPGYRNDYSYGGVSPIHADVMSGGGAWLSAFTYNWVLNKTAPQQSVQQQTQAALAPAGTALTLVGGRITDTQTAQISALLGVVAEGTILTPEPGAYSVRLLDAGGALVYSVTFDLPAPATSPIDPVPHPDADPAYYFSAPAPYALDGTNAIRQAALFYQGVELDRVTASSAVPTITTWTLTPGFETITATVTATDADNQPLTYRLAYSRDAVTWQEVGNGTVTPQSGSATFDIVVDQNELPGATAHHWQLLVSDGFYTVRAEQAGSFAIANKRPVAWIITYFADNTISGDQVLQWRGTGYDLEDGVLSGDQLIWYSDRDGEIGRGESLFIAADDLSAGLHVVSLEAVDSDGNSSVIVFTGASAIIPAPQMNTDASGSEALNSTVLLQVYRDRPYTPSILSVQDLSLAVPTGALYHATLSVTSIGDDGRLPWTLQTTPPAWLSFDQTSGETPTHINVTVNPATLTPGTTYTGTLTFQAGAPATQTVTTTYSIGIYTPSTFNIYLPLVLRNTP